jgi:hypothetical protein
MRDRIAKHNTERTGAGESLVIADEELQMTWDDARIDRADRVWWLLPCNAVLNPEKRAGRIK